MRDRNKYVLTIKQANIIKNYDLPLRSVTSFIDAKLLDREVNIVYVNNGNITSEKFQITKGNFAHLTGFEPNDKRTKSEMFDQLENGTFNFENLQSHNFTRTLDKLSVIDKFPDIFYKGSQDLSFNLDKNNKELAKTGVKKSDGSISRMQDSLLTVLRETQNNQENDKRLVPISTINKDKASDNLKDIDSKTVIGMYTNHLEGNPDYYEILSYNEEYSQSLNYLRAKIEEDIKTNDPWYQREYWIEKIEPQLINEIQGYETNSDNNRYAVYDTQTEGIRTLGTFSSGEKAMEAGSDYFVGILDEDEYKNLGGDDHFNYSLPKEDGDKLGFTAIEVTPEEAKLIDDATKSKSSIYYSDSFTGQGETFKRFPYINLENRKDIYGDYVEEKSIDFFEKENVLKNVIKETKSHYEDVRENSFGVVYTPDNEEPDSKKQYANFEEVFNEVYKPEIIKSIEEDLSIDDLEKGYGKDNLKFLSNFDSDIKKSLQKAGFKAEEPQSQKDTKPTVDPKLYEDYLKSQGLDR